MNSSQSPEPRRTARGHLHVEAFCLMWYACSCGHREQYWNSRDGVTPFGTRCPSCDDSTMKHVDWKLDQYAPNHKPFFGQRVWIDMTRASAERYVRRQLREMEAAGYNPQATFEELVDNVFRHGTPPDMAITGYGLEEK